MNKQSICRCVVASFLNVTAASWAQTSAGLWGVDDPKNRASCFGAAGQGDGPLHAFSVKPRFDSKAMALRKGGQFAQGLTWAWCGRDVQPRVGAPPACA